MKDLSTAPAKRPIGYFVHHQGRGHAERCAALVNALPEDRPVRIFCARDDIFPPLRAGATITRIPSLFEPPEGAASNDGLATPDTLHCAPVGWATIRQAMGTLAAFFAGDDPALMISDVSAEVAQLARICAVPHVAVLQHGDRGDPGHIAAYDGAVGLLAPFHRDLAQPDWPARHAARTHFAPGLGVATSLPSRALARQRLGVPEGQDLVVCISGGGGSGISAAPLGVAARSFPDTRWIAIGQIQSDWHATLPGNLVCAGWVDTVAEHVAAADVVISSAGNTLCHQILASGTPWIVVPEWRYFDEQIAKAEALSRAGAALHLPGLPASAHRWREAIDRVRRTHAPDRQRALVSPTATLDAARWLERLAQGGWSRPADRPTPAGASECLPSLS